MSPEKSSPPLTMWASLGEGITEVFFKESCWGLMWGKKDYLRLIFTILMLCLELIASLRRLRRPTRHLDVSTEQAVALHSWE